MSNTNRFVVHGLVVEDEVRFTLVELCHACHADADQLMVLIDEGVLSPNGEDPPIFGGNSLRRARLALRLIRDLELNASGTALVLDLLDEIAALESRLRRLSSY